MNRAVVMSDAGETAKGGIIADDARHLAVQLGAFAKIAEIESVAFGTVGRKAEWGSELKTVHSATGSGDFDWLPGIFIGGVSAIEEGFGR